MAIMIILRKLEVVSFMMYLPAPVGMTRSEFKPNNDLSTAHLRKRREEKKRKETKTWN